MKTKVIIIFLMASVSTYAISPLTHLVMKQNFSPKFLNSMGKGYNVKEFTKQNNLVSSLTYNNRMAAILTTLLYSAYQSLESKNITKEQFFQILDNTRPVADRIVDISAKVNKKIETFPQKTDSFNAVAYHIPCLGKDSVGESIVIYEAYLKCSQLEINSFENIYKEKNINNIIENIKRTYINFFNANSASRRSKEQYMLKDFSPEMTEPFHKGLVERCKKGVFKAAKKNKPQKETSSVTQTKKQSPQKPDLGHFEGNIYSNKYFGIKVNIPRKWYVPNRETQSALVTLGKGFFAGNNNKLKAKIDAGYANNFTLFMVFKHSIAAMIPSNAGLVCTATKMPDSPKRITGKDILEKVKKEKLAAGQVKVNFSNDIYSKQIGGIDFYRLDFETNAVGKHVKQEIYVTTIKGYALTFTLSYLTDKDKWLLKDLLKNIKFDKSVIEPKEPVKLKDSKVDITSEKLIYKMREAVDPDKKFQSMESMKIKSENNVASAKIVFQYKKPDKLKRIEIFKDFKQIYGTIQGSAWASETNSKMTEVTPLKTANQKAIAECMLIMVFKNRIMDFGYFYNDYKIGEKLYKVNGHVCFKLTCHSKQRFDGGKVIYYIDKKDFLIIRQVRFDNSYREIVNYYDYKSLDRIMVAGRTLLWGKSSYYSYPFLCDDTVITSFKLNIPIEDSTFKMPQIKKK